MASTTDTANDQPGKNRFQAFAERWSDFFRHGVWRSHPREKGWRFRAIWITRAIVLTGQGLFNNQLFMRAGSMSYSSVLALGPAVGLAVVISGAFLQDDPETLIKDLLRSVAPTLQQAAENVPTDPSIPQEARQDALDELINQIVAGSESLLEQVNTRGGTVLSILGVVTLIFIVIQLLVGVESAFNLIWGVRQGRSWGHRIVFYWTFISLGTILGLGATALLSVSNFASVLEDIPFVNEQSKVLLVLVTQGTAFVMLSGLLTVGYLFFPKTRVRLIPALIGGLTAASLLFLNNYLSVLYVAQVLRLQSVYGSLGILPVFMLGVWFFWLFILLGCQLTYAVQNVEFLSLRQSWDKVGAQAKESLALAAFLKIARRFQSCERPYSVDGLARRLRVPHHVLIESLERLQEAGWISPVKTAEGDDLEAVHYQPARPLSRLTLQDFHRELNRLGADRNFDFLRETDPLLRDYEGTVDEALQRCFGERSVEACLLEEKETAGPEETPAPSPARTARHS